MILLASFRGISQIFSEDKKPRPSISDLPMPHVQPVVCLSKSVILQVPKYTKNDPQQIFKTVLEARLFIAGKDSDEPQEQTFKPWGLDIYRNKFYIDYYGVIQ